MCVAELRGLGAVDEELAGKGGRLLAIAVDAPHDARRVAQRNNLAFPLLCDTQREVVRAYGLLHEAGGPDGADIAVPAVVLIEPAEAGQSGGRVVWRFMSRRIQDRLHPDDVLAAVRRLPR